MSTPTGALTAGAHAWPAHPRIAAVLAAVALTTSRGLLGRAVRRPAQAAGRGLS